MEKTLLFAVATAVLAAVGIFSTKGKPAQDSARPGVPGQLQILMDSRYDGLPTEKRGFAPYGWICVVEPPTAWNRSGLGIVYPICPKPDWYPYETFVGPPVPTMAVQIDPSGFMFTTPEGIRVHRDGWVVTEDGRAFRAKEKTDDMGFPELPNNQGA